MACPVILDMVGSSLKETVWCNPNSIAAFEVSYSGSGYVNWESSLYLMGASLLMVSG